MIIAIIVEGETERIFVDNFLKPYLGELLAGRKPELKPRPQGGRIPKGDDLKKLVRQLLSGRGHNPADYVIALTDVYTGSKDFIDATDAKKQMREWVGNESRFFPHAAQYEFEAWLLPYWSTIQKLTKQNTAAPSRNPETVNHNKPPSHHIEEIFKKSSSGRYSKTRDVLRILRGNDLSVAVEQCPELKAFVNTIISLCNSQ